MSSMVRTRKAENSHRRTYSRKYLTIIEYDAFGNTVSCEEQVHNRFRYTGEQYDPLTEQYYLRARYYNPVIARFTQEDTYYGDGLNLYTYCRNNPILNHDPTGHGTKENSPYSRKEQQYIDAGADPDTAKLATQCYPDAKSKQDLYNNYKSQGYNATDAKKLANYEIVHGEERAKNYAANNVKKSGPDYTPTSPRDNVNTDWRTQNRLNAQKKAGAGKSGTSSVAKPNQGQGFSSKGYNPQPGERTFEGYVKQIRDPEISLHTKSSGFNNNPKGTGGQFKRFGANEHYGLAPHVHQPVRNVTPNGMIFGKTGKDVGIDVFSPNKKHIKQLYEYLNNGKYHE